MPTSASELLSRPPAGGGEPAFERLHPRVQDLVRTELGWRSLRPIQTAAIGPVLDAERDVLLIAGTASGKTEAAWLPVFSRLLSEPAAMAVGVLAISPLKALIDDQTRRLGRYGRSLDLRVDGWHGDVAHSRKLKMFDSPPRALVITPESLQSLALRRPTEFARMLSGLRYVVVDEVHAFAGTDRGAQLQSLLHLIERRLGRTVPRIALSATVSEPHLMTEFLRPGGGLGVAVLQPAGPPLDLDVRVHGFVTRPRGVSMRDAGNAGRDGVELHARDVAMGQRLEIAGQIDRDTRGRRCLVFAGSRLAVEEMTSLLRDEEVTGTRRPERYHAHHGSLSQELRKAAEAALHDTEDAVAVCTSTLELGIDLPDLDQVAQVDTCLSIAGLRQRLGRSGRRPGTRPTLRIYVSEVAEPGPNDLEQRLRADLVQNVASVELIATDDWVEPTDPAPLRLSTLVHQTLALLADPDGVTARTMWEVLCGTGPWRRVSAERYAAILRSLAEHQLIRQDARGRLALDEAGLRLSSRRDFLAVFATPAEYTVRHEGRELGTLPFSYPLAVGAALVMGGRTWRVVEVKAGGWTVDVVPHHSGLPPKFKGGFGQVHRRVREAMRAVYGGASVPDYLDEQSAAFLAEGRAAFAGLGLSDRSIVEASGATLLALWTGDRELATVTRWMEMLRPGLVVDPGSVGLTIKAPAEDVQACVAQMLADVPPTALDLAQAGTTPPAGKYDQYLPADLLAAEFASRFLDVPGARRALEQTAEHMEMHEALTS